MKKKYNFFSVLRIVRSRAFVAIACFLFMGLMSTVVKGQYTGVLFTSSTTWTVPNGITQITIEGWGSGGGGGGSALSNSGGGGGGGGGYQRGVYNVNPGDVLNLTILAGGGGGAAGNNNGTAGSATTVTGNGISLTANGGSAGGGAASASGGTAGAAGIGGSATGAALVSSLSFNGGVGSAGAGGTTTTRAGGGGGGGAGNNGNGQAGTTGAAGGGAGGNGVTLSLNITNAQEAGGLGGSAGAVGGANTTGGPGTAPGGGGAGGQSSGGNRAGGQGGSGQVVITYPGIPVTGKDCNSSNILCDSSMYTQGSASVGFGAQEVDSLNSCWGFGGEHNSAWFKFSISCTGTLEFNVHPNVITDDYDWAIWDVTSDPLGCTNKGNSYACNWSGCTGATGISSCDASEPGEQNCNANEAADPCPNTNRPRAWYNWSSPRGTCNGTTPISVTAGHVYAMMIDAFAAGNNGFTLRFGGACHTMTAKMGPDASFSAALVGCPAPYTVSVTKPNCAPSQYTYLWTWGDGNTTTAPPPQSHIYASPGTYTISLKVTDQLGCFHSDSIVYNVVALSTSISSSTNVSCNGGSNGSATVSAVFGQSPYTYLWAPSGQVTATATGLAAGTYTVTATDANLCTSTSIVTITQPTAISSSVSSQTNATCNGAANGSATVSASGGTGAFTYSWSPVGGTSSTANNLTANTYTVTITDVNSCTHTQSVVITQPTAVTGSTSTTQATCGLSNGSASVTPGGGTPGYTYLWIPSGQTTATATGLSAGNYTVTITDSQGCTNSVNAAISNGGGSTIQANVNSNVSCNGGNDGSATVTVISGTAPFTYLWTPSGQTSTTAVGLSAGTYTVSVTDGNSCQSNQAVVITQPAQLTSSVSSQTNVNCNGQSNGSATVSVTGGTPAYSYLWAPSGAVNATATGLAAGTYSVTITDSKSCTHNQTVVIGEPTVVGGTTSTTQATCGQSNGTASVTASGGTPGYTYLWSPSGQTTITATGLSGGNYSVTITDSHGCTNSANATVSNGGGATIQANVISNVNCNGGNDGSASVSVTSGNGPFTYLWVPTGQTTSTAVGLSAGTYTVNVTDVNSCISSQLVMVTQPTSVVGSTSFVQASCGQSNGSASVTASGGTPGYTYLWTPSGQTTPNASGLAAGNYSVTITDTHGCTGTSGAVITNSGGPTATAGVNSNVLCNGGNTGSAAVSVSGGSSPYSYSWAPSGGNNSTATGLSAGTYTVTVTDNSGCSSTSSIVVTQPSALSISSNASTGSSCNNGKNGIASTSVSGGTGSYSYLWSPGGGTTSVVSNLSSGTYTITVTDLNGCTKTSSLPVNAIQFVQATANPDTQLCITDFTAFDLIANNPSPGTGLWSVVSGTGNSTGVLNPSSPTTQYSSTVAGVNIIVWTVTNSPCVSQDSVRLNLMSDNCSDLELPTGFTPNNNGINDDYDIHGIEKYPLNVFIVFNRWGSEVYKKENYKNHDWVGQNNSGDALPPGTYYVILNINDGQIVKNTYVKLIK